MLPFPVLDLVWLVRKQQKKMKSKWCYCHVTYMNMFSSSNKIQYINTCDSLSLCNILDLHEYKYCHNKTQFCVNYFQHYFLFKKIIIMKKIILILFYGTLAIDPASSSNPPIR